MTDSEPADVRITRLSALCRTASWGSSMDASVTGGSDAENRRLVREVLQAEGLSVIGEAGDGVAAVQITLEAGPDVVLMDLRMPVMGGIEATRLIKEASAHTQVIVLTSYEGPLPERSASAVGAYAYLVKDCGSGLMRDVIL